jgi:hypothetical protein
MLAYQASELPMPPIAPALAAYRPSMVIKKPRALPTGVFVLLGAVDQIAWT